MTNDLNDIRVGNVITAIRAGASPVCDSAPPSSDDYGVLTLTAVTTGEIDRRHAKRLDPRKVRADWPTLRKGTILITRGNGSRDLVGACTIVERDEPRLIPPDTAWILEIAEGHSARYLVEFLRSSRGRRAIHQITRGSSGIWKISQHSFLSLALPNTIERSEWAVDQVASAFDAALSNSAKLLAAKREFKRGLIQQLITGNKRFPQFKSRPWDMQRFDYLCEELSERNGNSLTADSVMGVIKGVGFERMRDRVRGKGDLTRYKVVPPAAFAYNPMRLNIGSIAYNNLGKPILVSPDYVVFQARHGICEPDYIDQLRYSSYWQSFMEGAGAGSVRVRIYFADLARLRVPAPKIDEQSLIAAVLRLADSEISLLSAHYEQMELEKRGAVCSLMSGGVDGRS